MAIEKSLVSGSMTMLILKLLSEKDMYGYEMIDTLRQKSQNVFELKAGTLYPLLHSLEDKGFLTVYEQKVLQPDQTGKGISGKESRRMERVFCSSDQRACNGGVIYGRISENITGTDSL